MDDDRAVVGGNAAVGPQLRRAYATAIARGSRTTQCTAEEERAYGALPLLTLAMVRLPDLVLCVGLRHVCAEEVDDAEAAELAGVMRDVAAGALRLAHRALETHARDGGYETGAWIHEVLGRAGFELFCGEEEDDELPLGLVQSRLAARVLSRATAATATDRMLVPDELTQALAHLLAVYVLAGGSAS